MTYCTTDLQLDGNVALRLGLLKLILKTRLQKKRSQEARRNEMSHIYRREFVGLDLLGMHILYLYL